MSTETMEPIMPLIAPSTSDSPPFFGKVSCAKGDVTREQLHTAQSVRSRHKIRIKNKQSVREHYLSLVLQGSGGVEFDHAVVKHLHQLILEPLHLGDVVPAQGLTMAMSLHFVMPHNAPFVSGMVVRSWVEFPRSAQPVQPERGVVILH